MSTEIPTTKDRKMENVRVINIGASQTPINFADGLALLFIGLKLTDHLMTWTWIEVLSPLWVPFMVQWFVRLIVHTFFAPVDEDEE
jgi:hypothetical protein